MDRVYLAIFYVFKALVSVLPFWVLKKLLYIVADTARFFNKKHRRIIRKNLDLAFGETISEEEKKRIIKACYRNLALNGADFIKNQNSTKEKILSKVTFANEEIMLEAIKTKKPIIAQAAHYGNWELLGLTIAAKFGAASVVGRALDSRVMDKILSKNREQFDVELIDKKNALRPMMRALNQRRILGILVDQRAGNDGIEVEFFGRKTSHIHAASILARKMDALIVPMFIRTDDHKHFTITFHTPIETPKTTNMEEDIFLATQAQANAIEKTIREKPDEWFWFHKRWSDYESYD
ncbi:MAG: lipid A biosynthesis lauroyl acyltransferase [Sulfurospirillaceae bacterium]|nr:lipid A biosynthesis lauroyl acyltransferase [Sulfurospirillaceae bacterium]MCK9546697.1 lipid A biosynthesis lauroyl acyltransferase [Sulfurospirillaceae bacterium]